jgi:hypothetical protein
LTGKIIDKTETQYLIKNIEINIDGNGTYSSNDLISFGKSDKTGTYLRISSPKSDNAISISINNDGNEFQK